MSGNYPDIARRDTKMPSYSENQGGVRLSAHGWLFYAYDKMSFINLFDLLLARQWFCFYKYPHGVILFLLC